MKNILEVSTLTKKFGRFIAVDNISFEIKEGEIVGLLGPNGAGKTTTIRMMLTFIIPDKGEINIFGKNLFRNREEILQQVNFTFVNTSFGGRLSVEEVLIFFAKLYQVKNIKNVISDLLDAFQITHLRNKKVRGLSSGEVSRVALCKTLINNPKVLFLDEPTASLDPDMADRTRKLIKQIQKERRLTIVYTSHNMEEVEEMCDRILFLSKGKILVTGTPLEITKKILKESVSEPSLKEVFLKISRGELL